MGRVVRYEPCEKCRARGADRRGDNRICYDDGGYHCFACGDHKSASTIVKYIKKEKPIEKAVIPRDFTREVPAECWKWLLQYGLPYSYWKPFVGYSPAEQRLVITHGQPTETSVGRYIPTVRMSSDVEGLLPVRTETPGKWKQWGDKSRSATVLGYQNAGQDEGIVCVVEDLISAHKVAQVAPCLPIFGTALYPKAIMALRALKRPVALWLDRDQWGVLAPKINRLQTFLNVPVRFVSTNKDPKKYSSNEIREILE